MASRAPKAYVRLTEPAIEDLRALLKLDPQVLRRALKKMLLLERDPTAGAPLLGALVGYRKLTIGDRDWRLIWRTLTDESGTVTIEIAEVWAVGARADDEIYAEMKARAAAAGPSPATTALSDVIAMLATSVGSVTAAPQPSDAEPVPSWLVQRLCGQAGMDEAAVNGLTAEQAMGAWEDFITRPR